MTTHSPWGTTLLRLVCCLAVLLTISSAAFAQPAGTVTKLVLKSGVLGEERTVLIRTPVGYETNKLSYPVLYMTDGDAHMDHTSSTIAFLTRNGRIPDLIVVGVTNTDRIRDLAPVKSTDKRFQGGGGADNFLKFFETELIPRLEKEYRVQPYRILAGHSLGGLFVIHSMITKPGLFNSYIAVSPALLWEKSEALKRAADFLKKQKEMKATLYVAVGNEELDAITEPFDSFRELLSKTHIKGFAWQAERLAGEDHGSVVLRSHYLGLRTVYDGWLPPSDLKTGEVTGGLKGIDAHYKKLSEKFGYLIPVPENFINDMGYQFIFNDKLEEAIAVFKANVARYPESANVYDSLADAYERQGRLDLAEPLFDKARTLGQQNNDPNAASYKANYERVHAKLKSKQP
jgi:predicted alpha/beta superfamily hydrolase